MMSIELKPIEQALNDPAIDMVWYCYGYLKGRTKWFRKENMTPDLLEASEYKGTMDRYMILEGGGCSP